MKLFFLLLIPLVSSTPVNKLDHEANKNRIIDGSPAEIGQFPWQVMVVYKRSIMDYFCGGSLIHEHWVLTAGSCVESAISFTLHFGGLAAENDGEKDGLTLTTTQYIRHPAYDSTYFSNDIAIIFVSEAIQFNKRIRPIRLPKSGEILEANNQVTVSGWGTTTEEAWNLSPTLQYVNLTTISNKECLEVYGENIISNSVLCAVGNPHHNICNGDSGDPLVYYKSDEAVLHGIANFVHVSGCASGKPSGYSRVESHLLWIQEITGL